jgi:hypothetical protein
MPKGVKRVVGESPPMLGDSARVVEGDIEAAARGLEGRLESDGAGAENRDARIQGRLRARHDPIVRAAGPWIIRNRTALSREMSLAFQLVAPNIDMW